MPMATSAASEVRQRRWVGRVAGTGMGSLLERFERPQPVRGPKPADTRWSTDHTATARNSHRRPRRCLSESLRPSGNPARDLTISHGCGTAPDSHRLPHTAAELNPEGDRIRGRTYPPPRDRVNAAPGAAHRERSNDGARWSPSVIPWPAFSSRECPE